MSGLAPLDVNIDILLMTLGMESSSDIEQNIRPVRRSRVKCFEHIGVAE